VLGQLIADRSFGLALCVFIGLHLVCTAAGLAVYQCPFHLLTGLDCPGCGMSRAVLCLLRGDWSASVQWHPFASFFLAAGGLVCVGSVLPRRLRLSLAERVATFERRTGATWIVLITFVLFGLVRLAARL